MQQHMDQSNSYCLLSNRDCLGKGYKETLGVTVTFSVSAGFGVAGAECLCHAEWRLYPKMCAFPCKLSIKGTNCELIFNSSKLYASWTSEGAVSWRLQFILLKNFFNSWDFPGDSVGKESVCQCRRHGVTILIREDPTCRGQLSPGILTTEPVP